jgi:ribosomal protein S18 acetylase RimI-like enzyme
MNKKISINKLAKDDIEKTKVLIKEYLKWIDINLSFQNINEELASFPEIYKEPEGAFLVAKDGKYIIGCVGLKKLENGICEMKRLYVKDKYKGLGIGKTLIEALLKEAKKKGYKKMRLDTLKKMDIAQKLYKEYGFYEINQYVENPIEGAVFLEKVL